jgi:hypothetical protein
MCHGFARKLVICLSLGTIVTAGSLITASSITPEHARTAHVKPSKQNFQHVSAIWMPRPERIWMP